MTQKFQSKDEYYLSKIRELQSENTRLKAESDRHCDDCACEIANERDRLKAENDELFYKLSGVMLSVDKWLDGEELNQDEVNRACTMREKTLQITERLTAERDKAAGDAEKGRVCYTCIHYDKDCSPLNPDTGCRSWKWQGLEESK